MPPGINQNVSLAPYTTLHVGGVADYLCVVKTIEELRAAVQFAKQEEVPFFVLGGGSNVLIADGQLTRLVIKNEIEGTTYQSFADGRVRVTAGAGVGWDTFVAETVARGLSGLQNLSGIPGTVGASPVQNINAYGASVADVIESVEVYDTKHDLVETLTAAECHFGYRDSIFKHPAGASRIVVAVNFILTSETEINISYRSSSQSIEKYLREKNITTPNVSDVREAVLHVRSNIGMLLGQFRSAGSFFKNTIVSKEQFQVIEEIVARDFAEIGQKLSPWHWSLEHNEVKIATAFLLECSPYNKNTFGNKRYKGVVGISPKHSLSIVTFEGATASDVVAFVEEIKLGVKNIFGVTLETEVDFISS